MKRLTNEQYEAQIAELANFCFHKLASIEARFIILCQRAQAVGIDCSDLYQDELHEAANAPSPLHVVN